LLEIVLCHYNMIPTRYLPNELNAHYKKTIVRELNKSKRLYKKGIFHTRKKIKGYTSKPSKWKLKVQKIYNLNENFSLDDLAKATKCSNDTLNNIVQKGMGAYYSSGSRPNQNAHSWGKARLYSAVSGGPASKIDYHLLNEGCEPKSKALQLVKINKQTGGMQMKEKIVDIVKSPIKNKKYRAYVKNKESKSIRHIDFGDNRYEQYKDRTSKSLYKQNDHGNETRRKNYFKRHSGIPFREKAIHYEKVKSDGHYNAKILSHECLW
jgi:hypothetical protein